MELTWFILNWMEFIDSLKKKKVTATTKKKNGTAADFKTHTILIHTFMLTQNWIKK